MKIPLRRIAKGNLLANRLHGRTVLGAILQSERGTNRNVTSTSLSALSVYIVLLCREELQLTDLGNRFKVGPDSIAYTWRREGC
jgi:hypothetical protein